MTNEADSGVGPGTAPGGPAVAAPVGGTRPTGKAPQAGKPGAADREPASRRGGRAIGALALLLALSALAGVGLLYWQPNPEPRLDALEARITGLEGQLGALATADEEALRRESERLGRALRAEIEARLQAGQGAAGAGQPAAAPAPRDWQLAEVRYLLRMANHRLLLERDAAGAATLLRAADQVLAALDDFALHEVRARIAGEVLALESLPAADAEGLFLQLEAIKSDVDRLPLRMPEFVPPPAKPAAAEGFWAALRAELGRLVRIRQFEGTVRPLLAPEEAVYLELNLRLMLERAQLAGLRHEQAIYAQSIATAAGWIERYLDVGTPEVRRVLDGLRALEGDDLAAPLPDISGSLHALDVAPRPVP